MKPIDKDLLIKLSHEQLVTLVLQQETQSKLQDDIMQMQEARIKELETEITYMENMVVNQRSIQSQGTA
jgi:hypothetical protein